VGRAAVSTAAIGYGGDFRAPRLPVHLLDYLRVHRGDDLPGTTAIGRPCGLALPVADPRGRTTGYVRHGYADADYRSRLSCQNAVRGGRWTSWPLHHYALAGDSPREAIRPTERNRGGSGVDRFVLQWARVERDGLHRQREPGLVGNNHNGFHLARSVADTLVDEVVGR